VSEFKGLPLNFATCSTVLHDDEAQRLIVTKSQHDSVSKDEKDRRISAVEAMSQLQLALLT
jgi:hypothetical protein